MLLYYWFSFLFLLWRTCKDNRDKAFADCSIPQEKSNAEINAELDLSDVSADEADGDGSNPKGVEPALHYTLIITMRKLNLFCLIISDFIIHFLSCHCVACRAPSWTHVKLNLFLHRNRRTQSIDEVGVVWILYMNWYFFLLIFVGTCFFSIVKLVYAWGRLTNSLQILVGPIALLPRFWVSITNLPYFLKFASLTLWPNFFLLKNTGEPCFFILRFKKVKHGVKEAQYNTHQKQHLGTKLHSRLLPNNNDVPKNTPHLIPGRGEGGASGGTALTLQLSSEIGALLQAELVSLPCWGWHHQKYTCYGGSRLSKPPKMISEFSPLLVIPEVAMSA
jgi:hypothetical protein